MSDQSSLAQAEARIVALEAEVEKHKDRRQHFEDLLNRSIEHENEWTQRALKAETENATLRQERDEIVLQLESINRLCTQ